MRHFFLLLLLLASGYTKAQCTQPIWADEFNLANLDRSKWTFENGNGCPSLCGWGNNELEIYTSDSKNAYIQNGILTLKAIRKDSSGSHFTSSKLVTRGLASWNYGRIQARMRMPSGLGLWPAFWMLSIHNDWPMTGEIDIMEYRGDLPSQTNSTLHYGSKWPKNQYDASILDTKQDLSSDFHVYSVEWEQNEMRFYFDQTLVKKETKSPSSLSPSSNGNP